MARTGITRVVNFPQNIPDIERDVTRAVVVAVRESEEEAVVLVQHEFCH